MALKIETRPIPTSKGTAEGIALSWDSFSLLLIGAPKGFLACCIFDLDVIQGFGVPAAIVESGPKNPIGTLDRMLTRTISKVNPQGERMGIRSGMNALEALEKLF